MKKVVIISFVWFLICTAFNSPKALISDYRDGYVGKYFCKKSSSRFQGGKIAPAVSSDTITITISKDALDSVLQINLGQQILKVKLINKVLQPYTQGGHYGGRFFANDSLSFSFSPSLAISYRYLGKKK